MKVRSARNHRKSVRTSVLFIVTLFAAFLAACQSNPLTAVQLPFTPSPIPSSLAAVTTTTSTAVTQAHTPTPAPYSAPSPMASDPRLGASAQGLKGYVYADNQGALFIQWTETGGLLSGTMLIAQPDGKSQSGTKTMTANFTGVRSGNHLSLTLPQGLGLSTTIAAELNDPFLTVYFPDNRGTITPVTLHPGNAAEFNDAVLALQGAVQQQAAQEQQFRSTAAAQDQQTRATADAQTTRQASTTNALTAQQERVRRANDGLSKALRDLNNDTNTLKNRTGFDSAISSYANHWSTVQGHYQRLQQDAAKKPFDCYALQTVKLDLSSMDSDLSSFQYDDDSLKAKAETMQEAISGASVLTPGVKTDIETVRSAYMELQSAVAANITGTPRPQFTEDDVNKAVNAAQQQIDSSTAAVQSAQKQAADYDQKAADLLKNAKAFVAGLKCQ